MNTTTQPSNRNLNIVLQEVMTNSPLPQRDSNTGERTFTTGETQILNEKKSEIDALQREINTSKAALDNSVKEYKLIESTITADTDSHAKSIQTKMNEQTQINEAIAKQQQELAFFEKYKPSSTKKSKAKTGSWFTRNSKSLIIVAVICIVELVSFVATLPVQREVFSWSTILGRFACVAAILATSLITHYIFNHVTGTAKLAVGTCLSATMVLGLVSVIHTLVVALTGDTGNALAFSFDLAMAETTTTAPNETGLWNAALNNPGLPEMAVAALLTVISAIIFTLTPNKARNNNDEASDDNSSSWVTFFVDKAKAQIEELTCKLNANNADIEHLNQTFNATISGYKERLQDLAASAEQFNVNRIQAEARLGSVLDDVLKSLQEYRVLFSDLYCERNRVQSLAYETITNEDILKFYNLK